MVDALRGQPPLRRVPRLGDEAAGERPRAHVRVAGEHVDRERRVEALEGPCARRGEAAVVARRNGPVDVLRLPAVAVRRDDVPARDRGRRVGAAVPADDVQAEVEAGGQPGGREDVAVVDVEDVGVDLDRRELPRELVGEGPVRRRAPAVEQAGVGEDERARADRHHARAPGVGGGERVERGALPGDTVRRASAGDDEVGVLERLEARRDVHRHPGRRSSPGRGRPSRARGRSRDRGGGCPDASARTR